MITSLLSALLAALPAGAPPAPQMPVTAPPEPPPMPVISSRPSIIVPDRPSNFPASTIEVELSVGARPLWSGTVRAGYGRPANFRQSLDEAGPDGCGAELLERQSSQRVEVSIVPAGYRPEPDPDRTDRFLVQATWTRPVSPGSCPALGSNTVQFQRIVVLRPGAAVEVEGDAGLRIRVRRIR